MRDSDDELEVHRKKIMYIFTHIAHELIRTIYLFCEHVIHFINGINFRMRGEFIIRENVIMNLRHITEYANLLYLYTYFNLKYFFFILFNIIILGYIIRQDIQTLHTRKQNIRTREI